MVSQFYFCSLFPLPESRPSCLSFATWPNHSLSRFSFLLTTLLLTLSPEHWAPHDPHHSTPLLNHLSWASHWKPPQELILALSNVSSCSPLGKPHSGASQVIFCSPNTLCAFQPLYVLSCHSSTFFSKCHQPFRVKTKHQSFLTGTDSIEC